MPKDNFEADETFTDAQLAIAGTEFEVRMAALERATIGMHMNQRQLDILVVLNAKRVAQKAGQEVETPIVSKFERSTGDHLGVDPQTIRSDIEKMPHLVEKVFVKGSNRDKTYAMSDDGAERYNDFNQGKVAIMLETVARINAAGPKPRGWRRFIPSLCAAAALAMTVAAPDAARSTPNALSGEMAEFRLEPVEGMSMPLGTADPWISHDVPFAEVLATRPTSLGTGFGEAIQPYILADRSSFFEEHLPKTLLVAYVDGRN